MQCIGKRGKKKIQKNEVLKSHLYKKLHLSKLLQQKHKEKQIVVAFCPVLSMSQIASVSREILSSVKNQALKYICIFFSYWAEFLCLQKRLCPMSQSGLSVHACEGWGDLPSRAQPAHPAWAVFLLLCANAAHLDKWLQQPVVLPLYNFVGLCLYNTPPMSNL